VLTAGAIALGVALVYWLAFALARSTTFALWAAACTLAIEPRLYNYPKVVVPMVAVWLVFRHLDRPGPGRAAAVGAWGAAGFLFRYDLGVYLAVFAASGLLLARDLRDPRALARDAAACGSAALALAAVFLPSFLLVIGALPFWDTLRGRSGFQAALRGINAAVVGLLLAALYQPVWTSAIRAPADVALALAAFGTLAVWKAPAWLVVLLTAGGGAVLSLVGR